TSPMIGMSQPCPQAKASRLAATSNSRNTRIATPSAGRVEAQRHFADRVSALTLCFADAKRSLRIDAERRAARDLVRRIAQHDRFAGYGIEVPPALREPAEAIGNEVLERDADTEGASAHQLVEADRRTGIEQADRHERARALRLVIDRRRRRQVQADADYHPLDAVGAPGFDQDAARLAAIANQVVGPF